MQYSVTNCKKYGMLHKFVCHLLHGDHSNLIPLLVYVLPSGAQESHFCPTAYRSVPWIRYPSSTLNTFQVLEVTP